MGPHRCASGRRSATVVAVTLATVLAVAAAWPADDAADPTAAARLGMVRQIESIQDSIGQVVGRSRIGDAVLEIMRQVPRHLFVPEALQAQAYADRPLPIGHGQTISQPYIVALMTDVLALTGDEAILEVGTGSGYQAAILGRLARRVFTIEIVTPLAETAAERLARFGFDNVTVRQGDGYGGWPEQAPFDAIVVTAAASHVPPPLIEQIKVGGRMAIPIGNPFMTQELMLVTKNADGTVLTRHLLPVRFVPLVRTQ